MNDSGTPRRRRSSQPLPLSTNTGPLATSAWLVARGLTTREPRWYVEITIGTAGVPDPDAGTVFRVELFREEWGFWFRHANKVSWIRVTDLRFVHGRDEHTLLPDTPPLQNLGTLIRLLETRYVVRFVVEAAVIRTNIVGAEPAIQEWLRSW